MCDHTSLLKNWRASWKSYQRKKSQ